MEKFDANLDSTAAPLRAEPRKELAKGLDDMHLEMGKMFDKMSCMVITSTGKTISGMVDVDSLGTEQKSGAGSSWNNVNIADDKKVYMEEMNIGFAENGFSDPMADLVSLEQSTTVEEFYEEFEAILNLLELSEEHAVSIFISNLVPEISSVVRLFSPKTLSHALYLAKHVESVMYDSAETEDELEEFSDSVESMEQMVSKGEEKSAPHTTPSHALPEIGVYQTMKLRGKIKNQWVIFLVGSGSAHNFIDQAVVKKLNCETTPIDELSFTVASGRILKVREACQGVKWEVQGLTQYTDFLVMPLGGCDLLLGIEWLETLGPIAWNFATHTMRFSVGNQIVTLRGLQKGDEHTATKKQQPKSDSGRTSGGERAYGY